MKGQEVYIVDYVRTPFSRARPDTPARDAFSDIWGVELTAETLKHMFDVKLKNRVQKSEVDEFLMGCSMPIGENAIISGKIPLWLAQFPHEVPGVMFDRQCGSGMTALHHGIMEIAMGYADTILVSGMEHQTRVPMANNPHMSVDLNVADPRSKWYNPNLDAPTSFIMIQTAQKLFELNAEYFTKQDLDKFGVRSHNLAEKAYNEGFLKGEVMPILGHKEGDLNTLETIDRDLSVRFGATLEGMKDLRVVSKPGWAGGYQNSRFTKEEYFKKTGTYEGVITPGNSSPMNAGSASMLIMSKAKMEAKGLTPMAKIVEMGWAAVDPSIMGAGPVPSTKKALEAAGLTAADIDYWEINEAFVIVALNAIREFNIDPERVNVKGGATAIGHPLSATGVRMPGTLARILKEKKARYGVANMCCGGGQGTTVIIENVEA